jgi:hypothetical protein
VIDGLRMGVTCGVRGSGAPAGSGVDLVGWAGCADTRRLVAESALDLVRLDLVGRICVEVRRELATKRLEQATALGFCFLFIGRTALHLSERCQ